MTHPENGKPLWEEPLVESLLEEFFRREMPAPLRGQNPPRFQRRQIASEPVPSAAISPAASSRANSKAGGLMVGFTLLLMLMVVIVLWNPAPQHPHDPGPNTPGHSSDSSNAKNDDRGEDASDALRHKGNGPVELRPRIQSVGTKDLNDPASEKSPFPELDVEVYPLDAETPAKGNKARKPEPQQTPMPEEHRELPEGQPRGTDPDEAQLEPMLPELQAIFPALEVD